MCSARLVVVMVLAIGCAAPFARGDDLNDLTRDLPLRIQDARPTEKGQLQLQGTARWERTDTGEDRTTLQPQLQYGLIDDVQLQLQAPYYVGDADRGGSGDVQLGAQWRFLKDDGKRPSIALAGQLIFPTGVGSDGLDTELEFDLTKGIGGDDDAAHRVHLNLIWDHNSVASSD